MNTWESASFTAVQIKDRIDNGTFVVPPYQRGYVWNNKQTDQFVDTLKRGLPFGTILLYHDEANNKYQIIDGLQRCTTIFRFINEPAPFFNEDDIEEELPQMLAQLTEVVNYGTMIDDIRNNLVAWVHRYRSMDAVRDMQYYEFAFQFSSLFPTARGKEREVVELVQPTLKKFKDLCEHLCTIRIPAIVIKGDDDALPEIFERINSKGTQLSKYQIYAATWNKKYKITSARLSDLIKINRDRYEAMAMDGTEIADFDSISFMQDKQLNLFEICYALGKKLGDLFPCLFSCKKDIKDVDSLGFSIITSCVGLRNEHSKTLHTAFDSVVGKEKTNVFLERILQSVETPQKLVGKFNKFKVNSKGEVGPLHTEFQIISLICNIFIARYVRWEKDDNDRLISFELSLQTSNEEWNRYETALKANAWKRYFIDIINARWKGAGDKKLNSVIFDKNYYARSIGWDEFASILSQWYTATKADKREHKRVIPPQESEKIFLAMLYLPIFTAEDQVDHSKYDVEHLATKNLMKKCLDRYNGDLRLPIGSIANLCLLPQQENRSKRDKTVYSDDKYLQRSRYTLIDLERKFTITERSDLAWIEDPSLDKDTFESKYNQYLDTRFDRLLSVLAHHYGNM